MQRFNVEFMAQSIAAASRLETLLDPTDSRPLSAVTGEVRPATIGSFQEFARRCRNEWGLVATAATTERIGRAMHDPDVTAGAAHSLYREFHSRMRDELAARYCFMLDSTEEHLYTSPDLFGSEVAGKFPDTIVDIEEAGKCLALGRATACVFHLMRVLEWAMKALAKDLKLAKTEKNWHELLKALDEMLTFTPGTTVTPEMKEWRRPRAAAVAHLRNVKDAWRNDVMHPRESYTLEQARDIFTHCRAFMAGLAAFL